MQTHGYGYVYLTLERLNQTCLEKAHTEITASVRRKLDDPTGDPEIALLNVVKLDD
jgi:hypothetical protein